MDKLGSKTVQEYVDILNVFIVDELNYIEYNGTRLRTQILTFSNDKGTWWSFYNDFRRRWYKEDAMMVELAKVTVRPMGELVEWWL